MAITLRRQLNDEEKKEIICLHGRKCFANGHVIADNEPVHFDHIRAFSQNGATEIHNIAPMCQQHNLQKGTLSLQDFRIKLRLNEFFERGDRLTVGDLLRFLKEKKDIQSFGEPVTIRENGDSVEMESPNAKESYRLYQCPLTGWRYFYATLDITLLDSDDESNTSQGLQPRYLIAERVFSLYQHFQNHPVLLPSIGRIDANRIKLFDGQHKIAGLLWTGRRQFEVKIYLNCEMRLLNQTNIAAHDKFSQSRFFSSIMVMKLGLQFGVDFEEYKSSEDGKTKSEANFLKWLEHKDAGTVKKGERAEQFRSFLYHSIIENSDNKLKKYVSASNRSSAETPLTIDTLSKSLFACFLYRQPVEDDMTTIAYKRQKECDNMIILMNMLHDSGLHLWNSKALNNDTTQKKLERIFRSKSMIAWSELLRDAILAKLEITDADDRIRPFYRELNEHQYKQIQFIVSRFFDWKFWVSASSDDGIDRVLADNKSVVKEWFKKNELTTGYLLGASS
jgi:hypothetical protein